MTAADDDLSLAAALFLVAIDPKRGRLVKRRRRRFRKALAGAHGTGTLRARRAAVRELRRRGFISFSPLPGHHPVVAGSGASIPFGRVRLGIEKGFQRRREIELCLLLTWCGVLQKRLTRSERKTMAKRLKLILLDPETDGAREHRVDDLAWAVGRIAFDEQVDILQEAVGDLLSGDTVTIDVGGGGGDGGGGDGGGGGGGGGGD